MFSIVVLISFRLIGSSRLVSQLFNNSFFFEAHIFIDLELSINNFWSMSFNASLWNKIMSCSVISSLNKGLNFKNGFNSFSVEMNEMGPKIRTFNWCIF